MKLENKDIKDILYKELRKAYKIGEVPVACVIVDSNGKVIAKGHNKRETKKNALCHAEVIAINKACHKLHSWRLDDLSMYVTLEPCVMCTGAIIQSRINKVTFYAKDKRNGSIVSSNNLLDGIYTHKVDYEYIEDDHCSQIITKFFKELRLKKGLK